MFEAISALSLKVYPVPAKYIVNIVVPSNIKVEAIEVYNGFGGGVLIETNQIDKLSTYILNTEGYVSGYYRLRMKTESGLITKRFSILK